MPVDKWEPVADEKNNSESGMLAHQRRRLQVIEQRILKIAHLVIRQTQACPNGMVVGTDCTRCFVISHCSRKFVLILQCSGPLIKYASALRLNLQSGRPFFLENSYTKRKVRSHWRTFFSSILVVAEVSSSNVNTLSVRARKYCSPTAVNRKD